MTYKLLLELQAICVRMGDKMLPIRTAYKLNKLALFLSTEMEFYKTKFNEIIYKYAQLDSDGKPNLQDNGLILLKDGVAKQCERELIELDNIEIELPNIKFNLDEIETFELTVKELALFMMLIEE